RPSFIESRMWRSCVAYTARSTSTGSSPVSGSTPDCVTDWTQVAPDGGLYRGVDAANVAVASYFGTFEDFHSRPKTSCTPIRSVWSRSSATAGGLEVATER